MRLIDADKARENSTIDLITHFLDRQPTIEAEPVKHGRWEHHYYDSGEPIDDKWYCSECSMCGEYRRSWYCPNCGAKMDLEVSDE